ncbi:nucleoside triphosphate pyrophosphohydrolase [Clostridium estertheticum]|uniref:nucleoside triphosphate pyrophosphohydrolase n=1 Tax=Clostridium estertheticum TaxID=238834 RepID=UPI001C7DD726|nr:nucleoside triphosphate pyrophosphohydrolase [Clostridium estertheticum]MBX4262358.1 nucleoside triphosphate pyrophosphohydrolase [Clostridium estertheticum]WLC71632.1 nucleoside triphosphate pyrophosphohydrolase [Clostridium estertheticum]
MKTYNKLVRDKIPEIIKSSGKNFDTHYAKKEEILPLLETKLNEEVSEYLEAKNLEELADVMEVLFGLANALGYSQEDLINKRNEKKEERGGFEKGIVLEKVYE